MAWRDEHELVWKLAVDKAFGSALHYGGKGVQSAVISGQRIIGDLQATHA
jgi:hypothetical protein